jgi:hypothetical protein
MNVQFDKEVLIKHHFWILLGVSVLLVLIALVMLPNTVGSAVKNAQDEFTSTKEMLKRLNKPMNQKWVDAYTEQDKQVQGKKNVVWGDCWKVQEDMMTWPVTLEQAGWDKKYPYFGDDIEIYDLNDFPKYYDEQLFDVYQVVNPLSEDGKKGAVQFSGGFESVLKLGSKFKTTPSKEDIWLAQEELWVKRELLRIVNDANETAARFKEVDSTNNKSAQPAAKDSYHKRYRSPWWEIDLTAAPNDKGKYVLSGTLKNVSHRRLARGVEFRVLLDEDKGFETANTILFVDGEPLGPGQSIALAPAELQEGATVKGLFGVEQILNWRNVPVKRIDQISLDAPASRVADRTLVKPSWMKSTAAPTDPMAPPSPTAASSGPSTTKNGFSTARYLDISDQLRHIPVGMAVIIDEDQVPEFLAAFANSKLRIQTLQCHWRHTREKIQGPVEEVVDDPDLNKIAQRRRAELTGPKYVERKGPQKASARASGGRESRRKSQQNTAGPTKQPVQQAEGDDDMNLVELAVYGSASLYERFPPKQTTSPTAANPAAPSLPTK